MFNHEKEEAEIREFIDLLIPLPNASKEAVKNLLLGMHLNEQANKARQTA